MFNLTRLALLGVIGAIFLASPAHAVFIFIPGFVIDKAADVVTGAKGEHCVPSNARMGDVIAAPDGTTWKIVSLSGSSYRCRSEMLPVRAEILQLPMPSAETLLDSQLRLQLPNGWESKPVSPQLAATGVVQLATNATIDAGVSLLVFDRSRVIDIEQFAFSRQARQASLLREPTLSAITSIVIDSSPAWRYRVTGKNAEGALMTFEHTLLESKAEIVLVNAWTTAAAFNRFSEELRLMPAQIRGLRAELDSAIPKLASQELNHRRAVHGTAHSGDSAGMVVASPDLQDDLQVQRKLKALNRMLDEQLITQSEFQERRRGLLDEALRLRTEAAPSGATYLCCNMRTDGSWISDANYPDPYRRILPAGTPIRVTGYGRYRVHVEIDGKQQALGNDYSRDLSLPEFAGRYVVSYNPANRIAALPPKTRLAVRTGRLVLGMTRQEVLMSLSYPTSSENPFLDAKVWRYWWKDAQEFRVVFDGEDRLKEVEAEPAVRDVVLLEN